MFNFKTLLLTTIATLGLTANVQGCTECAWGQKILWGFFNETACDYACKNADALCQELKIALFDAQVKQAISERLTKSLAASNLFDKHILSSSAKTSQELFADPQTRILYDNSLNALFITEADINRCLPKERFPHLNYLGMDSLKTIALIRERYQEFAQQEWEDAQKGDWTHNKLLQASHETKAKIIVFMETSVTPAQLNFLESIFAFSTQHKKLIIELLENGKEVLKQIALFESQKSDSKALETRNKTLEELPAMKKTKELGAALLKATQKQLEPKRKKMSDLSLQLTQMRFHPKNVK